MQSEFQIMKKQLTNLFNENNALKTAVREVNKTDMIRGALIIRNTKHDILPVDRILEGELQPDVSVGDYVFIQNFCDVIKMAYDNLEMGNSLDKNMLIKGYRILSENPEGFYRTSNPVVYAFNHVPPRRIDISVLLKDALKRVYNPNTGNNVVMKAMYLHNKIIEIYPFNEYNGELAVFAMNYYLMENGLMPVSLPMQRQEYLDLVNACLKGSGNSEQELYNIFYNTISDKMQRTISACSEVI